jgi:hypothetical protein
MIHGHVFNVDEENIMFLCLYEIKTWWQGSYD